MTQTERRFKTSSAREAWINKLAQTRRTIWPDIKRFVQMGMRPAEIGIALKLNGVVVDEEVVGKKIANAMGHRPRKGLSLRTPQERRESRIAALNETPQEREQRVRMWLETASLLISGRRSSIRPRSRSDWETLIHYVHARREEAGIHIPATEMIDQMYAILREKHMREGREKTGQTLRGRKKSEEELQTQSHVWNLVSPWAARGATVEQIKSITDLTKKQVWNAVHRKRSFHVVDKFLVVGVRGKGLGESLGEDKKNSLTFAKTLYNAGLITWDMTYYEELMALFAKQNRKLTESASDRARLEVLLRAHREGDIKLLARYRQIGQDMDEEWFDTSLVGEEDFVALHAELKGGLQLREDRGGFFILDEGDYKWRSLVEGGIDNSQGALQRQESRERQK